MMCFHYLIYVQMHQVTWSFFLQRSFKKFKSVSLLLYFYISDSCELNEITWKFCCNLRQKGNVIRNLVLKMKNLHIWLLPQMTPSIHLSSPLNNRPCTHLSSTLNETLHSPEKPIKRDPPSHHWVQHLNLQTPSSESPWGHITYQCVWVDGVMEIPHSRQV